LFGFRAEAQEAGTREAHERIIREIEQRLDREFERIRAEVRRIVERELRQSERGARTERATPPPARGERPATPVEPRAHTRQAPPAGGGAPAWLGVFTGDVDEAARERANLGEGKGIQIESVVDGSPAEKAGLRQGDILVEAGGRPVKSVEDLRAALRQNGPGRAMKLSVIRDGKARDIEAVPIPPEGSGATGGAAGQAPEARAPRAEPKPKPEPKPEPTPAPRGEARSGGTAWLGVLLEEVTSEEREEAGIEGGVKVSGLPDESPAREVGIREGDLIVRFGDREIAGINDLVEAVRAARVGTQARVTLYRGKERKNYTVKLGRRPAEFQE
jgi:membrane-associated protease RseP (regulator of RpoE activity)